MRLLITAILVSHALLGPLCMASAHNDAAAGDHHGHTAHCPECKSAEPPQAFDCSDHCFAEARGTAHVTPLVPPSPVASLAPADNTAIIGRNAHEPSGTTGPAPPDRFAIRTVVLVL